MTTAQYSYAPADNQGHRSEHYVVVATERDAEAALGAYPFGGYVRRTTRHTTEYDYGGGFQPSEDAALAETDVFAFTERQRTLVDARAAANGATVICYDHRFISTDDSTPNATCPECADNDAYMRRLTDQLRAEELDRHRRIQAAVASGRYRLLDFGGPDGCAVPTWPELDPHSDLEQSPQPRDTTPSKPAP